MRVRPERSSLRAGCRRVALLLVGLASVAGCDDGAAPGLRIATDLNSNQSQRLREEFADWWRRSQPEGSRPPELNLLIAAPGVDPASFAEAGTMDVILGGSASAFGRLARMSRLRVMDDEGRGGSDTASWRLRSNGVGVLVHVNMLRDRALPIPEGWDAIDNPGLSGLLALDDPRRAPVTLAWASATLQAHSWAEGYARLVRCAALANTIGRQPDASLALLERNAVAVVPAEPTIERSHSTRFIELGPMRGRRVAILRPASHVRAAAAFVHFLDETYGLEAESQNDALQEDLLADLLGATLVDAHDELILARRALENAPSPRLERFLTESPPWPPASIQELWRSDSSGSLVAALVAELSSSLAVRSWLMNEWSQPARPLDETHLGRLANELDGALALEPRFRDWLRAEWTAWARQRYRRVARQAGIDAERHSNPSDSGPGDVR